MHNICGSLLYTIRPIQEALALFYERQISRADAALQQQSVERRLAKLAPVSPCEELCAALGQAEETDPAQSVEIKFEPLLGDQPGANEKAG